MNQIKPAAMAAIATLVAMTLSQGHQPPRNSPTGSRSLSFWGRLRYRTYRHPLVTFGILFWLADTKALMKGRKGVCWPSGEQLPDRIKARSLPICWRNSCSKRDLPMPGSATRSMTSEFGAGRMLKSRNRPSDRYRCGHAS